jgi:hypothetical protein
MPLSIRLSATERTEIMTLKSTLNEDTLQREWLVDKVYNPKKVRSLDLAKSKGDHSSNS